MTADKPKSDNSLPMHCYLILGLFHFGFPTLPSCALCTNRYSI